MNVLIADDEQLALDLIAGLFRDAGCEVDVVSDGVEAVKAARQKQYDLIVLDGVMPRLSGLEVSQVIRDLRNGNEDAIILGVSGHPSIDVESWTRAGMDMFFRKPVGKQHYRDLIQKMRAGEFRREPAPDREDAA